MNKELLEKASNDIQLIKQIITSTSNSLVSFSRIIFLWGILYFAAGIIWGHMPISIFGIPFMGYYLVLVPLLIFAFIIYHRISRTAPLEGLSKQLITIWTCLIVFEVSIFPLAEMLKTYFGMRYYINHTMVIIFLIHTFGLLCTCVLTRFKFPGFLALIYIFAVLYFYLPTPFNPIYNNLESNLLDLSKRNYIIIYWATLFNHATFLILGGYLELKRIRGNLFGNKLNT
ncbi:hypothetical protein [Inediibacterium massiliense]|uniref:hypothetical protein n=1 Tax=Inediibacterium massiliense TaxID=1658111 RepID=UPI0006B599DA|nr:hypothetical protein [Inediibacterium massiliense]